MPAATNSDRIQQLETLQTELRVTSNYLERDVGIHGGLIDSLRIAERTSALEIAVLKEKIAALEKSSDNSSRIKWAFGTAIISVSVGALLNYLLRLSR